MLEKLGAHYYSNGVEGDVLQILKNIPPNPLFNVCSMSRENCLACNSLHLTRNISNLSVSRKGNFFDQVTNFAITAILPQFSCMFTEIFLIDIAIICAY